MVGGVGMGTSVGGGGGEGMSGGATQAWVNTNFVSIEFFGRLFKAYGPGENEGDPDVEVLPNDMDSTISNIEAMFGFWTGFYLTALGNGGEISASVYLAGLADVNVAGVQSGQVLTWNQAQNKWIATTPQSGVDMNQVWNALAVQTSQQINASHLTDALNGYATQTWVGQQGFLTASDLNGYATQTWVGQQGFLTASDLNGYATESWVETHGDGRYLKLTGGELTGMLKVTGAPIFGYVYSASNNRAAFIFDKPGSNYTGIGANGVSDQIYMGACDGDGKWVTSYKQKWLFNGDLSCDDINATGDIAMNNNSRIYNTTASGGSLYIGRSNDEGWVKLSDVCSRQGDSYWKIYSSGDATFANVYSNGAMTALSDEREKNIIENFEVPLKYIAEAPVVLYTWKDERRGDKQHIGSIAQYWLKEMPELVPEVNGRYTMDYGRIALLSAILTARHVVNLEQRLAQLEKTLRGE